MNDRQTLPFVMALITCSAAMGFVVMGDWQSGAFFSLVTLVSTTLYDNYAKEVRDE